MGDGRSTSSEPRWRLRALVLGLAVLGAAAVAVAVDSAVGRPVPEAWPLVLGLSLLALGALPLLHLRWGSNRESLNCAEVGLVFGLTQLPLDWLVIVTAVAAVIAQSVVSRLSPVKVAFNTGLATTGAAAAGWLTHRLAPAGWSERVAPGGLEADAGLQVCVVVAVVVMLHGLWQGFFVALAVSLAQSVPLRPLLTSGLQLRLLVSLGNTVFALGMLGLADFDPQSMLAVPPFLFLLFIAYRAYLATREERDVWRRLEESTRAVTSLDEPQVVGAALAQAVRLFRADRAEVVVESAGQVRRHVVRAPGRPDEADEGTCTWISTSLRTSGQAFGHLRVGLDGEGRLSERERAVFTAFGHTVSAALENARLYAGLRRQAERSAHAASHDELTGLPNRSHLQERAQEAFAASEGRMTALLLVDLDHFKEINDTLGHSAGDRLLREVARRLRGGVRDGDLVARLGGDEFAILLPGLPDMRHAEDVATAVLRVLSDPVDSEGVRLAVEGSIGIAAHPQDAAGFEELLQRADVALYQAKTSRGSWRRYDPAHDDSSVQRLALVAELRGALARNELVLHYQPQVDLATGRVVAAEALARWEHPRRGLLNPQDFVPAAEHSGLVRAFTVAVLEMAVAECAQWRLHGHDVRVAVNLSARSLLDHELPRDVAATLRHHGLPPDRLVVEITETVVMSELDVVEEVLGALRRLGVTLSVDDFGTGYSSLAFLRRVAVNEVKIDKSFVRGMLVSRDDAAIVRATIQLAESLGLSLVAEGVESELHQRRLAELGCPVAQGYHLGKPEPAARMRRRLGIVELPDCRHAPGLEDHPVLTRLTAS